LYTQRGHKQQSQNPFKKMVKSTDSNDERRSERILKSSEKEHEPGMRVGENYQAVVPEAVREIFDPVDVPPEALLVWAPCDNLTDVKMNDYLETAKDKFGYNMEQALGMLYWHKYEIEKAAEDLRNFTPLPDEWSMEDKVVFDQSFHSYGKSFPRIRQQLPDKSIGSLVRYYYSWKKSRNKKSLMDKNEKKAMSILNGIFADDENMENDSSDSDYEPNEKKSKTSIKNSVEKQAPITTSSETKPSPMLSTNCVNCAGMTSQMNSTPRGKMCVPCYDYWRRTGGMRPKDKENVAASLYHGPQHKLKRKPPKGIQLNQETLIEVAQVHGDSHVRPLEIDLINLKRQILTDKVILNEQSATLVGKADKFRPPLMSQANNPRWTNEELLLAVQSVRRYGKEFQAMTEVLGNKTVGQCRNFFINYRHRYNLLDVLAEYEKANNIPRSESRLYDTWEETGTEGGESSENVFPTSSHDSAGVASQPPPLRRQSDNTKPNSDVTKAPHGPPPLVNNSSAPIITSAS